MLSTFSLDAVPASERREALQASFASYALPITTRFSQVDDVSARFAAGSVGRVRLERFDVRGVSGTAIRRATTADSAVEPTITLHALERGHLDIRHAGRISTIRAGTLMLSSTDSPLAMHQHNECAMSTITVPLVDARLSQQTASVSVSRAFAATDPVASTAVGLLRQLTSTITDDPGQSWEVLEGTLIALIRALVVIGASSERDATGSLSETLTDRVLRYVQEHVLEPSLDADMIAAAHGISTRYLYVILRNRDLALGEHIRSLRLQYAARLLRDPLARRTSIADIAHRAGFADHAHFSRSFRRAYDIAPSEWRNDAHSA
jgi:AraC-like DNA-binding protein